MRISGARRLLVAIAAASFWFSGPATICKAGETAHTVELIADKDNRFKFADGTKGPLLLKAGERVTFRVTARFGGERARDGSVHGFAVRKLREQGWDVRLKEGVQEFTLTAPPPGEYLIECTVKCGTGHDDMNLRMVVK